jgi:hypothetical protein
VLAVLQASPLFAGGTSTFDFLRVDVGARAAAMAGSFVSVTNDPNTLFYNPAGLGTLEAPMGSVGFFKHLLDINAGSASYAQALEDLGWFGAGVVYTNYGSFDRTDYFGNTLGTFSANDLALALGYANVLEENLTYGVGLKFIYSSVAEYSATGIAWDIGLLYTIPESKAALGISIRNFGAQLDSYADTRESMPLDIVVGGSIVPRGLPLMLNLNFHKLNEEAGDLAERFRAFSVGGEFTLSSVLQLRFGYNNEQRRELKIGTSAGLAGFSGGLGVTVSGYNVDYALSSLGKIGGLHRITVGTSF